MKRGRMGKPKPEAEPGAPLFEEKVDLWVGAIKPRGLEHPPEDEPEPEEIP